MKNYYRVFLLALLITPVMALAQSASKEIQVPFKFGLGKSLYEKHCGSCHGNNGFGVDEKGPPLMHKYYEPSHHGNQSFIRAIKNGVKQHHWNFGKMEPIPELNDRSISKIISYVRWLQLQHGIF